MEVTGDLIPVGQYVEFSASDVCRSGLIAKPAQPGRQYGHHLEVVRGESPWFRPIGTTATPAPGTSGPQRQRQQRRTCVGQFVQAAVDPVDPSRNAVDEAPAAPRPPPESFAQQWKPQHAADCFQSPAAPHVSGRHVLVDGNGYQGIGVGRRLRGDKPGAPSRGSVPDNNSVAMSRVALDPTDAPWPAGEPGHSRLRYPRSRQHLDQNLVVVGERFRR